MNRKTKDEKKIMSPELNFFKIFLNITWTFPYHAVLNLFQGGSPLGLEMKFGAIVKKKPNAQQS